MGTINPAVLTNVNWSVANASSTYGTLAVLGQASLSGVLPADQSGVAATVGVFTQANAPVALTSRTAAGSYLEEVTGLTGSAAFNYTLAATGNTNGTLTINPLTIAASFTGVVQKTYDGTNAATVNPGNYQLVGVLSGDTVSVSGPTSGLYDNANAGSSKTVTVTGVSLSGPDAGNYAVASTLSNPAGVIAPEPITVTAVANTKTYDGSTAAAATPMLTAGTLYNGATLSASETYAGRNAGTGLTLIPAATVSDPNNYAITLSSVATGVINPEPITITAAANTKTYDGGLTAAATPTVTAGALYDPASLTETYASKDVGAGLTLTPAAGITNAGNYVVTLAATTNGVITPEPITITAAANTKTYDGGDSAAARPTVTSGVLYDPATLAETYAGPHAGAGLTLNPTAVISNAGDYSVTLASANVGVINPEPVTITAVANTKTFDGSAGAAATPLVTAGVFHDPVTLTEAYATRNAGAGLTLTPTASLGDPGDYAVTAQSVATGVINPEPITVTAVANSKTYDGGRSAAATPTVTAGALYDPATLSETYGGKDVGSGLTLTPSITLADAGNYVITLAPAALGVINPEPITITASANTKAYDSTTAATAVPTVTAGALYDAASLTESYAAPHAGAGLTLTPAAVIANATDYAVTLAATTNGVITPEAVTITAVGHVKTYDGGTTPVASRTAAVMPTAPAVTSGTLYDPATLSEAYATPQAGAGLVLTPTATLANAADYAVTLVSQASGVINPESLTLTAAPNSKTFDGGVTAAATPTLTSGTLYNAATLSETYSSRNAGTGLTLTPAISLADPGDYSVSLVSASTGVIRPEPITLTAVANTKTYDATTAAAAVPLVTVGALYDPAALSETYAAANAGTGLTLTPAAVLTNAGNYAVTLKSVSTGVITPEPVTLTAVNAGKIIGQPDPALTFTLTSGTLLDGAQPAGVLTRQPGTGLGTYVIEQGTLSLSANYALTFQPGLFTINPPPAPTFPFVPATGRDADGGDWRRADLADLPVTDDAGAPDLGGGAPSDGLERNFAPYADDNVWQFDNIRFQDKGGAK